MWKTPPTSFLAHSHLMTNDSSKIVSSSWLLHSCPVSSALCTAVGFVFNARTTGNARAQAV